MATMQFQELSHDIRTWHEDLMIADIAGADPIVTMDLGPQHVGLPQNGDPGSQMDQT